jgi:hypothetical protein
VNENIDVNKIALRDIPQVLSDDDPTHDRMHFEELEFGGGKQKCGYCSVPRNQ